VPISSKLVADLLLRQGRIERWLVIARAAVAGIF